MIKILVLGFLLGMRHTLEADHVAAVATLAARSRGARQALLQGAAWGLGHTITLFLACSAVLFLETVVPEHLARGLEAAVGVMLMVLGADVVRRMLRERVHFHAHRHRDGTVHFHAHSHAGENVPDEVNHGHTHAERFPVRALCVGLVHGMAGSAALILLTLSTVASPGAGLLYVALFGAGSIGGMAMLSLAISVPLRGVRRFTLLHHAVQTLVGIVTMGLGGLLVYKYLSTAAA